MTEKHLNPKKNSPWYIEYKKPLLSEEEYGYAISRFERVLRIYGPEYMDAEYSYYEFNYSNGAELMKKARAYLNSPLYKALQ